MKCKNVKMKIKLSKLESCKANMMLHSMDSAKGFGGKGAIDVIHERLDKEFLD